EQNDLSERVEVETFIDINTFEGEDTVSTAQVFPIAVLVGMTFYFSIFTILLMMINLVEEKKKGTWNRLIFSPLSKTKIYMGQLLHYFLVGLVQIGLSFTILRFLVGTSLGTNYLSMLAVILSFVFAIVSLGLLIIGLVNSPQQLQVVIPIVTTSMAMIGGAFWPLDVVSNRLLLFLAELMPIKHGLQGMMGAIVQGRGITELLEPISALLLMGVLFMGVGLNLMERVSEKRSV
ncbi:MAG: ABC transporter permease, partial [Alkalibacterium sp.]